MSADAPRTVEQLVARLGERQAYTFIVAESIRLRMALSAIAGVECDSPTHCRVNPDQPCVVHVARAAMTLPIIEQDDS